MNWGQRLEGIGAGWIILLGVLFFFFPEPVTSFWGAILILIGVGIFLVGWWRDRQESETVTA